MPSSWASKTRQLRLPPVIPVSRPDHGACHVRHTFREDPEIKALGEHDPGQTPRTYHLLFLEHVQTLADRIAREGALPALDAAGWVIRIARRVEALHSLGVAHGAISADCLMFESTKGTSRGIFVDARRLPSVAAFHSPERASGEQISQSDDTWALAVVLYVTLTGQLPFSGASDEEVRQRILAAQPAPLAVFGLEEDGLQRVLDGALARDKGRRITAILALRQAIEEAKPEARLARLIPLDDDEEGDEDDDKTIVRPSLRGITPMQGVPIASPGPAAGAPPSGPPAATPPSTPLKMLKHTMPMDQAFPLPQQPQYLDPPPAPPPPPGPPSNPHVESPSTSRQFAVQQPVESTSSASWRYGPPSDPYQQPSSVPAPESPPPLLAGASKLWFVPAAAFGALLATAVVLFIAPALRGEGGGRGPEASAGSSAAPTAPSGEPTTADAAAPMDDATAGAAAPVGDPTACMRPLFAEDTWEPDQTPGLGFVCTESDPRKGGQAIRAEVVQSSGQKRVSEGMREWAVLGWYEMAAFAVLRARCCPSAPALSPPGPVGACPSIDEALGAVARNVVPGASEEKVDEVLQAYARAVRCVAASGSSTGGYPKPQGGEDTALRKTLMRVAAPKK